MYVYIVCCSVLRYLHLIPVIFCSGGEADEKLVVSFFNGKSAEIPLNTAVWLPQSLHDRITFELQLPAIVRQEITQHESYPVQAMPGYPACGPNADPEEFVQYDPVYVRQVPVAPYVLTAGYEDYPYTLPYYPFPVHYKYAPKPSAVKAEAVAELVPGFDMTNDELSDKVRQQLEQHDRWAEQR